MKVEIDGRRRELVPIDGLFWALAAGVIAVVGIILALAFVP